MSADTTYRIYDWDRKDAQGNSREMHTEEALEAIDFKHESNYKTEYHPHQNATTEVVNCPQFTTNIVLFDQILVKNLVLMDSFVIYIGVEGKCQLQWEEDSLLLNTGEAILVPAVMSEIRFVPETTNVKLLEVYLV